MTHDWQIAAVKAYDGEREKLGNAEQFYVHLLQLPSYRLRVELMLFRSELETSDMESCIIGARIQTSLPRTCSTLIICSSACSAVATCFESTEFPMGQCGQTSDLASNVNALPSSSNLHF